MRLSAKDKKSDEWQAAIEALLMAAEERGPIMHARIGMLKALNRGMIDAMLHILSKDPGDKPAKKAKIR